MEQSQFIGTCNAWAGEGTPFLFIIDYELEQFRIFRPEEAARQGIFYDIRGRTNVPGEAGGSTGSGDTVSQGYSDGPMPGPGDDSPGFRDTVQGFRDAAPRGLQASAGPGFNEENSPRFRDLLPPGFRFEAVPMAFPRYEKAFSLVKKHIMHGNSFLLNLTFPTPLRTDLTLQQIFHGSVAPYRLLYGDRFVVFSPETFVKISGNVIRSFPMKGTIDASLPGAERQLLGNEKELWEHNTIVDLIRNDLSMVAGDVRVARFRYVDRVRTHRGELLQVSSEIEGRLAAGWRSGLGELLLRMLPAGSICGAPKRKTVEIIAEAEGEKRGFFTGIFGIFDGEAVDSAVMIRYIERINAGKDFGERTTGGGERADGESVEWGRMSGAAEQTDAGKLKRGKADGAGEQTNAGKQKEGKADGGLQFRSGGGITGHSEAAAEYNEMIEKVYVPIVRN